MLCPRSILDGILRRRGTQYMLHRRSALNLILRGHQRLPLRLRGASQHGVLPAYLTRLPLPDDHSRLLQSVTSHTPRKILISSTKGTLGWYLPRLNDSLMRSGRC